MLVARRSCAIVHPAGLTNDEILLRALVRGGRTGAETTKWNGRFGPRTDWLPGNSERRPAIPDRVPS